MHDSFSAASQRGAAAKAAVRDAVRIEGFTGGAPVVGEAVVLKATWHLRLELGCNVRIGVMRASGIDFESNMLGDNRDTWGFWAASRRTFHGGRDGSRRAGPDALRAPCDLELTLDATARTLSLRADGEDMLIADDLPLNEPMRLAVGLCCNVRLELLAFRDIGKEEEEESEQRIRESVVPVVEEHLRFERECRAEGVKQLRGSLRELQDELRKEREQREELSRSMRQMQEAFEKEKTARAEAEAALEHLRHERDDLKEQLSQRETTRRVAQELLRGLDAPLRQPVIKCTRFELDEDLPRDKPSRGSGAQDSAARLVLR